MREHHWAQDMVASKTAAIDTVAIGMANVRWRDVESSVAVGVDMSGVLVVTRDVFGEGPHVSCMALTEKQMCSAFTRALVAGNWVVFTDAYTDLYVVDLDRMELMCLYEGPANVPPQPDDTPSTSADEPSVLDEEPLTLSDDAPAQQPTDASAERSLADKPGRTRITFKNIDEGVLPVISAYLLTTDVLVVHYTHTVDGEPRTDTYMVQGVAVVASWQSSRFIVQNATPIMHDPDNGFATVAYTFIDTQTEHRDHFVGIVNWPPPSKAVSGPKEIVETGLAGSAIKFNYVVSRLAITRFGGGPFCLHIIYDGGMAMWPMHLNTDADMRPTIRFGDVECEAQTWGAPAHRPLHYHDVIAVGPDDGTVFAACMNSGACVVYDTCQLLDAVHVDAPAAFQPSEVLIGCMRLVDGVDSMVTERVFSINSDGSAFAQLQPRGRIRRICKGDDALPPMTSFEELPSDTIDFYNVMAADRLKGDLLLATDPDMREFARKRGDKAERRYLKRHPGKAEKAKAKGEQAFSQAMVAYVNLQKAKAGKTAARQSAPHEATARRAADTGERAASPVEEVPSRM